MSTSGLSETSSIGGAALPGPRPLFTAQTLDRRIWQLAVPAISENLLQTALLIVDTLMIARFGSVPVAASCVAGVILWRVHMTLGCFEKGTVAMVARYHGEGNAEKVGKTVAQSMVLALGIGLIVTIVGIPLARPFFVWMGAAPDVVAAGTPFLRVILAASVARLFVFVAAASLRGMGDTRSPMWVTLWMNVLNLGLNYILIFGHFGVPQLRLLGSGIATCVALFFAAVAIAVCVFRGTSGILLKPHHFIPDMRIIRTMVRISIPSLFEEIVISFGFLIFSSFIASLGTSVLAAHAISTRIESVSFMAGHGFAVATTTLVGQSLGMGNVDLARTSFRRTTACGVLVMFVISLALILFGSTFVDAFKPDEEVRSIALLLLIIVAVEQPLLGICMTMGGGLRGAGDTLSPMLSSLAGNVVVRVFVVYWLAFGLGLGIYGVYLGTVIDWVLRSAVIGFCYFRGRWARLRI